MSDTDEVTAAQHLGSTQNSVELSRRFAEQFLREFSDQVSHKVWSIEDEWAYQLGIRDTLNRFVYPAPEEPTSKSVR